MKQYLLLLSASFFILFSMNASQINNAVLSKSAHQQKTIDDSLTRKMDAIINNYFLAASFQWDRDAARALADLKSLFAGEKIPDINTREYSCTKRTPLICAVRRGFKEIVTVLIQHGADLNKQDMNGVTALSMATDECAISNKTAVPIIQLLIAHGAHEHIKNSNGKMALDFKSFPLRHDALVKAIAQREERRKEQEAIIAETITEVTDDLFLDLSNICAGYAYELIPPQFPTE